MIVEHEIERSEVFEVTVEDNTPITRWFGDFLINWKRKFLDAKERTRSTASGH